MTDRPIIFSAPMIRALLAGTKTQTRRILKPPRSQEGADFSLCPAARIEGDWIAFEHPQGGPYTCIPLPYAHGDRLWVREAHALIYEGFRVYPIYRAEHIDAALRGPSIDERWRPSIHMPRWASRITLHVEDVRVQRVQEIDEEDARAEGVADGGCTSCGGSEPCGCADSDPCARETFAHLWDSIHGPCAWGRNDWVAAITFRVIHANIDVPEAA